jgi:hypothetical protein
MMGGELLGKQLQILKEVVPNLSRVAVLWNPSTPVTHPSYDTLRMRPGPWDSGFVLWKSVVPANLKAPLR